MSYWGFRNYYEPSRPRPVKDGLKTKNQRGEIGATWWSKRWISVLESFDMGARLGRGRAYARAGQVVSIDVAKGIVSARVQGSRPSPYSIKIELAPISDMDWEKVTEVMAAQALFAAKLLSGEMPQNIEEAFAKAKVRLFPASGEELETKCSCPDWANPCKHVAAVYYILAERFDEDPFLIFHLRGRTKEEIIDALRAKRSAGLSEGDIPATVEDGLSTDIPPVPLEECLDTFWQAGPDLNSVIVDLALPEIENAILKRLGNAPFTSGKDNLASLLGKACTAASRAALRAASGQLMDNQSETVKELPDSVAKPSQT